MALATTRVLTTQPLQHKPMTSEQLQKMIATNLTLFSVDDYLTNFSIEYHNAFAECHGRSLDQVTSGAYRVVCPVKGVYRPKAQEFHNEVFSGVSNLHFSLISQQTSCGAATRMWPLGIMYSNAEQFGTLMEMAIENSRITHHHPIGYVGGVASAIFMYLAMNSAHVSSWGTPPFFFPHHCWTRPFFDC